VSETGGASVPPGLCDSTAKAFGDFMKLGELKVNAKAAEEGAWVNNIPDMGGLRFKVRGANNRDWRKLQARLIESVPRKKRALGRLDPDEQDRINAILLLETGLQEWEGLEADDGKPLPYSKATAKQLLDDPEMIRFREAVMWACMTVAEQEQASADDTTKN
jgi:hypothetical protein